MNPAPPTKPDLHRSRRLTPAQLRQLAQSVRDRASPDATISAAVADAIDIVAAGRAARAPEPYPATLPQSPPLQQTAAWRRWMKRLNLLRSQLHGQP